MLGKTFKGMTDEMLAWQTERFTELASTPRRSGRLRRPGPRPSRSSRSRFDGVQRSTRYPGGVALRFARVRPLPRRQDPAEADTLAMVKEVFAG